ncbi:MAG: peptide ABC transporter substrate-binding protein [Magnetospirillum sp.]|nr:peptide ABC transporter substrate-binding protein [Magnetospirillum sp.]
MPFFRRLAVFAALLLAPGLAMAKDELVIGITQFPAAFHPSIESMLAKTYILGLARRPLTAFDAQWKLVCMLCTELPTLENGLAKREGKGIAVTYTLRPDARWGDGTPVSSDDAVFTWLVGRHPLSGVASRELYQRITRVEVKGPRTFILHFDRTTFDYNAVNDFALLPAHIERPRFESAPAEYRNRTAFEQDTTNPGLYNGPFHITEVVQGSAVVLAFNPQWTGPRPAFNRIVVKTIENTAALEANLLSGGVDMIAGELGLPLDQALAFEKRQGNRFVVTTKPSLVYEHIDLNLTSPILADVRVRRALLLAADRATLTKQLFAGRQPVAHALVPQLDWVHADDLPKYPYDPAKAAALLDEAGWKLSGGIRRNAKGDPLAVELATTAGNRSRELVAQVLQAQWRKAGIEVRLVAQPPRVFFGDTVTKRRFPHLAMFAWYSAPESVPRSQLHSSMVPEADNNWAGQNYTGYADPDMDQLIDAIEVELDRVKRKRLWRDLQVKYATDLPALPLYFRADAHIWPKALKGVVPTGHQDPSTLWVEQWRWE